MDIPNTNQNKSKFSASSSKKFQEDAFQYVSQWCKAARDYVNRKVERWKLLEDLYHNRRELN